MKTTSWMVVYIMVENCYPIAARSLVIVVQRVNMDACYLNNEFDSGAPIIAGASRTRGASKQNPTNNSIRKKPKPFMSRDSRTHDKHPTA